MPHATPWRAFADGVELTVRVTPGAASTRIDGIEERPDGPVLKLRVAAPPEAGRANAALVKCLAGSLSVPRSAIVIAAGHGSRTKRLRIDGDPDRLRAALAALAG